MAIIQQHIVVSAFADHRLCSVCNFLITDSFSVGNCKINRFRRICSVKPADKFLRRYRFNFTDSVQMNDFIVTDINPRVFCNDCQITINRSSATGSEHLFLPVINSKMVSDVWGILRIFNVSNGSADVLMTFPAASRISSNAPIFTPFLPYVSTLI